MSRLKNRNLVLGAVSCIRVVHCLPVHQFVLNYGDLTARLLAIHRCSNRVPLSAIGAGRPG